MKLSRLRSPSNIRFTVALSNAEPLNFPVCQKIEEQIYICRMGSLHIPRIKEKGIHFAMYQQRTQRTLSTDETIKGRNLVNASSK